MPVGGKRKRVTLQLQLRVQQVEVDNDDARDARDRARVHRFI